jgi:hypothetical protein
VLELASGVNQHCEGIGDGVTACVADDEVAVLAEVMEGGLVLDRDGGLIVLPFGDVDAVGEAGEFVRGHAMVLEVLFGLWQKGDDVIGGLAGGVFGPLHQHDEGVSGGHATQFDRAEGPEVVDFKDQFGLGAAGDVAGGINVEGIGGRIDDDVGLDLVDEAMTVAKQLGDKGENINYALGTVAFVGGRFEPDVADAVDRFDRVVARDVWGLTADVRLGGGDDRYLMPQSHPLAGKIVWSVLHPVVGSTCIVINQKNIHFSIPT